MNTNKKQVTKKRTEYLIRKCNELKIYCDEFNPGCFRLSWLGKIIDYYPKSNKCFWHSDKVWGDVENLNKFLSFEYGTK